MREVETKTCDRSIAEKYLKPEWLERLGNTPFLTKCRDGNITKAELLVFLKQHQLYSKGFTRYLAALLSNIENGEDRLALSQNLFDEMGLGDAGTIPHSTLYLNMMDAFDVKPEKTCLPGTQKMVDTMFDCCKSSNRMVGLGALCLGAEAIVPYVYGLIVKGFLSVGATMDDLTFFNLHIACDDDHSETMYKIIDREIQENPNALVDLNYGAEKMIQARLAFFEGVLA